MGLATLFYKERGPKKSPALKGLGKVAIKEKNGQFSIYKDNQPFLVKGGVGFTHIKELAECGGNTLTCWDTAALENALREASLYHVYVIIGLDIPDGQNLEFYNDKKNASALFNAYSGIVNKYRDHPAVLAYCLGNELTFPFTFTSTSFYKTYDRLLAMINNIDPQHPVGTSTMNVATKNILNIRWRLPGLDFICINTYNRIKTIGQDLDKIKLFWNGPYLVSEWSPDGGWEANNTTWGAPIENTSTKRAEKFYEFYKNYMPLNDPRFLGSVAFYWGSRVEYTYTWYSVFNDDGSPTEIKEVLNNCWTDTITTHQSPLIQYMLIDSLGANDNIILSAGSTHKAAVLLQDHQPDDSLHYYWKVLEEDWQNWGKSWKNFKKPKPVAALVPDSTLPAGNFTAPVKEGPYRIFVTVYNSKGYCATSNTPIYVVEK